MKTAVIDTNVWISGLFWQGTASKVIAKIYSGFIIPCFSLETFTEWSEKVKILAEITGKIDHFIRYQKYLQNHSLFVSPKEKVTICRDPEDNKFLETALCAKADFLISGDKDLLIIKKLKTAKILSPREFLLNVK